MSSTPTHINDTNMKRLAQAMAHTRPVGVSSSMAVANDWITEVKKLAQTVVAPASHDEFLRLCDEGKSQFK